MNTYNNFLIVGANFNNKGAQSMLFITMDEIKKRFPDANIFFASNEKRDLSNYNFRYIYTSDTSKNLALGKKVVFSFCKSVAKDVIKTILGKRWNTWMFLDFKKVMNDIDVIVDVSGFNLGKKWDAYTQEFYLDNIRLARKFNIPIYLMPQSFGPFDYSPADQYLVKELGQELPNAKLIFAREQEGYQQLLDTFSLDNVVKSTDLVLQNTGVNLKNIYKKVPKLNIPDVKIGAVGIVPNNQCFVHGDRSRNLEIYKKVIETLLGMRKIVYIFRHSAEDLEIVREIAKIFDNRVIILDNDFSCFEYDEFIKQFDFIICSRYHGVVHAYRNCVPSILLGWAVKYKELAELLDQGEYSFDITDASLIVSNVVAAVKKMCVEYKNESETIRINLEKIQLDNCFEKAFR